MKNLHTVFLILILLTLWQMIRQKYLISVAATVCLGFKCINFNTIINVNICENQHQHYTVYVIKWWINNRHQNYWVIKKYVA